MMARGLPRYGTILHRLEELKSTAPAIEYIIQDLVYVIEDIEEALSWDRHDMQLDDPMIDDLTRALRGLE